MSRILYSLCGADSERPFSPHCWKVVMALDHKGLEFTEQPGPFTAIPSLENGFSKTVPVLRDGDLLVRDSFDIALYLDEAYPDRPSLFGGEGGKALARFVEGFSQTLLHPAITKMALLSIHGMLADKDQAYFRASREARFGKTLEEVAAEAEAEKAAFPAKLEPLRHMLKFQPYFGGVTPLFADYIVFGAFQWGRITAGLSLFAEDDPVGHWFDRCLDLFNARGRTVTPA